MRTICLLPLLLLACNNDKDGVDTSQVDSTPDSGVYDQDRDGFGPDDDCDDTDSNVNPDAEEICDLIDNNCDGVIDEDATDAGSWYTDVDGDTYGDEASAVISCDQPEGTTEVGGDCADADATINPGAAEQCDGIDNDCDGAIDDDVVGTWYEDTDADGYGDPATALETCNPPDGYVADNTDCDDATAATYPGADELCNDVDDDCDGSVDEDAVDMGTWYDDADADGYGEPGPGTAACDAPAGTSATADDCDDDNTEVHPDAGEQCDSLDNDCDGSVDEDVVSTWYGDSDGDGHGDPADVLDDCDPPAGYSADGDDCDDAVATTYPGADETCNDVDDDCDGSVDEDATDATTWYTDADGDGYGDPGTAMTGSCESPGAGYVANGLDCDDADDSFHPDADEICDGMDNDCDGVIDNDAIDADTWYADADSDGYGDALATAEACDAPVGYTDDDSDCDDLDAATNPDADEICDTLDNDCNGLVDDDAVDGDTWYYDDDEDGFGADDDTTIGCEQPEEYVAAGNDCDDLDAAINPDADEICDGVDNDCDGTIDDGASDAATWYEDGDGDGYGDATGTQESCEQPSGYVATGDDCDDSDAAYNPGALEDDCSDPNDYNCDGSTGYSDDDGDGYAACEDCDDTNDAVNPSGLEVCNGLDDDCDGTVDGDGATDPGSWYADADGDGFGDAAVSTESCDAPTGYVADDTDCDDAQSAAYPGATEICDGLDNDCDGAIDDDAAGALDWYADTDGDGFGDPAETTSSCDQPSGYVADATDCDDTTSSANPSASEMCDSIDNDCDGSTDESDAIDANTYYKDADGDYYGDKSDSIRACKRPSGYRKSSKDCDDTDASIHPKATEYCNDIDDDCDKVIDDNPADATTWYADDDGDTFGDPLASNTACDQPSGYLADDQDCDDADAAINPDADEVCDGVDNDCDGTVDGGSDAGSWYADLDGDGYGDPDTAVSDCVQPEGYVADDTDCDDLDADTNPAGVEVCDGIDNDCDGSTDGSDATDQTTWYEDGDEDAYGGTTTMDACDQPAGYVAIDGDCDDSDSRYNPAASENCSDRNDYNCDGSVGYTDGDGDGTAACEDCDDADASAYPGATEICDGADNDCDSSIDESGAVGESTWYADSDGDSYGDAGSSTDACDAPTGYTSDDTDCDDSDGDINPGALELCDGVDNDCDGVADDSAVDATTWYRDADRDGYGDAGTTKSACSKPSGYVADNTDCDDTDSAINPAASEVCDGEDNDCDGSIDEGSATDAGTWYADDDSDGFGDPTTTTLSCDKPTGYVSDDNDCDDTDGDVNPDATELCDEIDNDCDGEVDEEDAADATTWYYDDDGDGFGDDTLTTPSCDMPTDYTDVGEDCDDGDSAINPDATDVCDGVDNDCSGYVDDGSACGSGCEVEYNGSSTYLFCTTAKSWTSGQSTCSSLGYHMVAMADATENTWVRDMAVTYSSTSTKWWIGLNDRTTEGSFVWESGDAVTYTNWASGEPNNSGNEDCTQLNRFSDYTWNDEPCTSSFRYICEL